MARTVACRAAFRLITSGAMGEGGSPSEAAAGRPESPCAVAAAVGIVCAEADRTPVDRTSPEHTTDSVTVVTIRASCSGDIKKSNTKSTKM